MPTRGPAWSRTPQSRKPRAAVLPATAAAAAATAVTATAAATTAAAAIAATAAAAATATLGLVLRLVDLQRTTAHVLTVQGLDRAGRVGTGHFDEAEATGAAGLAIVDQADGLDGAMLVEQGAHLGFIGAKGQVAHINLAH